jgi:hypothetical protein
MLDATRLILILLVYFIGYGFLVWLKPAILYDSSKTGLRPFGVGYKQTTILPLWLVSILLAIFSYFVVLYFIHMRYSSVFMQGMV